MSNSGVKAYPEVPGDQVYTGDLVEVKLGGEVLVATVSSIVGFRRVLRLPPPKFGVFVCQGWIHLDELRKAAYDMQTETKEN